MRKTFQNLLAEYGVIAAIVYFTIFFGVWISAWAAIQRGVDLAALAHRVGGEPRRVDGGVSLHQAASASAHRTDTRPHAAARATVRAYAKCKALSGSITEISSR